MNLFFNFGKLVCFQIHKSKVKKKFKLFSSLLVYSCLTLKVSHRFDVCNLSFIFAQTCHGWCFVCLPLKLNQPV